MGIEIPRRRILGILGMAAVVAAGASTGLITLVGGCTGGTDEQAVKQGVVDIYDVIPKQIRPVDPNKKSLIYIFDSSGSMDESLKGVRKIDSAKQAMKSALLKCKKHDDNFHDLEVGVLYFPNGNVECLIPLSRFNYDLIMSQVNKLDSYEGTPLGIGLAYGERMLDANASGKRSIILLTDGENTVGREPDIVWKSIIDANRKYNDYPTKLYVIPFNTEMGYFNGLKQLGAVITEAKEGKQLEKILVTDTDKVLLEAPLPTGEIPVFK